VAASIEDRKVTLLSPGPGTMIDKQMNKYQIVNQLSALLKENTLHIP